jgi:CDP-paratose 2-epimerase
VGIGLQHRHHSSISVAITGGAGFVGHKVASRMISEGKRVTILDDLSSPYAARHARSLKSRFGQRVRIVTGDIRDRAARQNCLEGADVAIHLAGQPNSAKSMAQPRRDFDLNARSTGEFIAELLSMPVPPALVYASGREVYGSLRQVDVEVRGARVEPCDPVVGRFGLWESTPLRFETPLGCSKAVAEQHVQWAATKGIAALVIRLGAVYGPEGGGSDDSESLTALAFSAVRHRPLFLAGDGRRVRDWLYVEDAAEALATAAEQVNKLRGRVLHAGGGPGNSASDMELVEMLGGPVESRSVCYLPRGPADPEYFVCDNRNFTLVSGWRPRTSLDAGIECLRSWAASESMVYRQGVA